MYSCSVDSIVSSNGQEDHVSMGANSALKLYRVVNNLTTILSIELMNATQAFQIINKKSSKKIHSLIKEYRKVVPFIEKDTDLYKYISKGRILLSIRFRLSYLIIFPISIFSTAYVGIANNIQTIPPNIPADKTIVNISNG